MTHLGNRLCHRLAGGRFDVAARNPLIAERNGAVARDQLELPCQEQDPDLWFADDPADLELAKTLCADCPARLVCLVGAIDRQEPFGVWGGQIFDRGCVVTFKRRRGRPRKDSTAPQHYQEWPDSA